MTSEERLIHEYAQSIRPAESLHPVVPPTPVHPNVMDRLTTTMVDVWTNMENPYVPKKTSLPKDQVPMATYTVKAVQEKPDDILRGKVQAAPGDIPGEVHYYERDKNGKYYDEDGNPAPAWLFQE